MNDAINASSAKDMQKMLWASGDNYLHSNNFRNCLFAESFIARHSDACNLTTRCKYGEVDVGYIVCLSERCWWTVNENDQRANHCRGQPTDSRRSLV